MRKNIKMKKPMVFVLIAVLIVTGATIAVKVSGGNAKVEDQTVNTVTLKKQDVLETVRVSGKIESVSSVSVTAKADGKIQQVNVIVGQEVKKGEVLAKLDTGKLENELGKSNAQSKVAIYEASGEISIKEKELENAKLLFEGGEISREELNRAESNLEKARLSYEVVSMNQEIDEIERQIQDANILAPTSGTVTMVNAVAGNVTSGILFTIEDTKNLKLESSVTEYDVNLTKEGQLAVVKTEATGTEEFDGEVLRVALAAKKGANGAVEQEGKVEFPISIKLVNTTSEVKIGMRARANIITGGKRDVLAVPYEAVLKTKGNKGTILIAEKKGNSYVARAINVTTGVENEFLIEIAGKKLMKGMKVISNQVDITDGQTITIQAN